MSVNKDEILSMRGITKIYSNGFVANKNINFSVRRGEIHGLVGENGAGKSTLMKVLFGEESPEEGKIFLHGEEITIDNPLSALKMGIGMVHQHFMLVPSLTVAENMVFGIEPKKAGLFDYKKAVQMTREISEKYALPIDPEAKIRDLYVGEKQRVEILKILLRNVEILILDEPTAVLTPQETVELFTQLKVLKDKGYTIIFISHKLNEIKQICDRVTVLRDGCSIATVDIGDVSEAEISSMMVGRNALKTIEKKDAQPGDTVLSVRNINYFNRFQKQVLFDISFDVRSGEVLGIAGVEGNGQKELSEIISRLIDIQDGRVFIHGKPVNHFSIREIREMDTSHISEDRMTYGTVTDTSIEENIIADRYYKKEYCKNGFLRLKKIRSLAENLIKEFEIKCDGPEAVMKTLSGGNMQKVVAAREFSASPKLIIANQPTRGIDVGASELIRNRLITMRDRGAGVLLISADLTELLEVSDSIIVLFDGRIAAYFPSVKQLTEIDLGEYMLGMKTMSEDEIGGVLHENI